MLWNANYLPQLLWKWKWHKTDWWSPKTGWKMFGLKMICFHGHPSWNGKRISTLVLSWCQKIKTYIQQSCLTDYTWRTCRCLCCSTQSASVPKIKACFWARKTHKSECVWVCSDCWVELNSACSETTFWLRLAKTATSYWIFTQFINVHILVMCSFSYEQSGPGSSSFLFAAIYVETKH